jgi:Zn-finger nucleic acid-binding protein
MDEQTCLTIELKYCERCGGLWLRHEGSQQVYCVNCAPAMAQVARGAKKRPAPVKLDGIREGAACA